MTPTRIVAAIAALATALLLQATLVAPISDPWPISLPAVLVALVALHSGAGTGIAFGFSAGLVADLGSSHPAGVLALSWLVLGLACGRYANPSRSWRARVALAAVAATLATVASTLVLTVLGTSGAGVGFAFRAVPATLIGDLVLAALLAPLVRSLLRSDAMRAPRVPDGRRVVPRG
jgi:rod shape-determining protein MreD